MINLLVTLLILCLILAAAYYIITQLLPLPEPIGRVVQVVFVVLAVIIIIWFLLALIGHAPGLPVLR